MKEFKGTPGSWKVSKSGNETFTRCVTAEDGGSVCFVTNWFEHEANAKLIAAAPELLEALKGFIDPLTGLCYSSLEGAIGKPACAKIEAATNKAL